MVPGRHAIYIVLVTFDYKIGFLLISDAMISMWAPPYLDEFLGHSLIGLWIVWTSDLLAIVVELAR